MSKFSKNVSKAVAIITGFGMSFGACNLKAMDSSIKIDEKRISDEVDKQLKKEDQSMYAGMAMGSFLTIYLYFMGKCVIPYVADTLYPAPGTSEN